MRFQATDDEPTVRSAGRKVSLLEAFVWLVGIGVVLATTFWLRELSLTIVFYTTLAALSWRLARAMHVKLALLIALTIAMAVTASMVPVLQ